MSSDYGVTSTTPLSDLPDDPEILATNFFMDIWDDTKCGVAKADIDFGYEPEQQTRKKYSVKFEEAYTDIVGKDIIDKLSSFETVMDCKISERGGREYKTLQHAGHGRYKIRKYVERVIKQNNRSGISVSGNKYIKHLYPIGGRNTPEPERSDIHSCVVTFIMQTFKTTLV